MATRRDDSDVRSSMKRPLETTLVDVKPTSTRARYLHAAAVFDAWLADRHRTVATAARSDLIAYRAYLAGRFASDGAAVLFAMARKVLAACERQGGRTNNPAERIGVYLITEQSVQRGLTQAQVSRVLDLPDTASLMGKRDYVLLSFLLQLGLSPADCVALSVGDVILTDGHVTALRLGEDKERVTVRLAPSLAKALAAYIGEAGIDFSAGDAPLLGSLAPWGQHLASPGKRNTNNSVARILRCYTQRLGLQIDKTILLATVATAAPGSRSRLNQAQLILGCAIIDVRRGG